MNGVVLSHEEARDLYRLLERTWISYHDFSRVHDVLRRIRPPSDTAPDDRAPDAGASSSLPTPTLRDSASTAVSTATSSDTREIRKR